MRSLLLGAMPYTPAVNLLVHPLVLPLSFSYHKAACPRILFLNLDGKETYFNLRALRLLPEQMRYISVFGEPKGEQLHSQTLDSTCEEF